MQTTLLEARAALAQDNPLNQLVNFEQGLESTALDCGVSVKLSADGKSIHLQCKNRTLSATVDRPIIHQLGSRAWGEFEDFPTIHNTWNTKLKNPAALEQEISSVFQQFDLIARHYRRSDGKDRIYGLVSPRFVQVNQLNFRELFLEEFREKTGSSPRSYGIGVDRYGNVVEHFDLNRSGRETEYRYGLVYARNSGYQSYKVDWERWVLVCSNGLKGWRGASSRWKHTRDIALSDFVDSTLNDGVVHQQWLEDRIELARSRHLQRETVDEMLSRLSLANATKERVRERVIIEANEVGANEWALSQAMTWLGTHERAIASRVQAQLTDFGTGVVETSLLDALLQEYGPVANWTHGLVLPEKFVKAA